MSALFLQALKGENASAAPPVWLMRQAGRYLPNYRELRARYDFLSLCCTAELAAKVTLTPFDYFPLDAAILFSDILLIAQAWQRGLYFAEASGPIIDKPIATQSDIEQLPSLEVALGAVESVFHAITLVKPQLSVPLLGFAGAPFTLASYLIEGKSSPNLNKTKQWMMSAPHSFHQLLEKIADFVIGFLKGQIAAGVDAIQLFDTWALHLAPAQFNEFCLAYLEKIMAALRSANVPVIVFCKGSSVYAEQLATLKPAAISMDHLADMPKMRKLLPQTGLQGNLDPSVLFAEKKLLARQVQALLDVMRGDPAYIFNLGHGVLPQTPLAAVQQLVELVHGY